MSINKVHIRNFTVFENMEIEFVDAVNIVIGTNGTGKTHLLKSLYAICESSLEEGIPHLSHAYFSVDSIELVRQHLKDKLAILNVSFSDNDKATWTVYKKEELKMLKQSNQKNKIKSIFIPAKEMLSHSKGFLALYNKYKIPFDKTYVDILTNAELPEARETSGLDESLLQTISKVIGGKVLHENGVFYIVKTSGAKIEFPIEAEGLRKFGLLWKLIKNGLLEKGTVLFWDEPEANINPELMPILVEVMLELGRKGVQLFIATHSYNLAKYFEVKRNESDRVLYHHLYQTDSGVQVDSNTYFGQIKDNPIIEADAKLLDEVIEGNFDD